MKTGKQRRSVQGFTLVELLVVLAILGMLAALVGPQVLNQLGGAKSKSATIQIRDLEQALELYKLDVGRFPNSTEGLKPWLGLPGVPVAGTGHISRKVRCRLTRGVMPMSTDSPHQMFPDSRLFLRGRWQRGWFG